MHDLIPLSPATAGALTTAEIDLAMHFAENEKSAATRKAYAADWRDFAAWCAARDAMPLPAHPGIVAAYLSSLAQTGRKASTIARKAAAIGHRHTPGRPRAADRPGSRPGGPARHQEITRRRQGSQGAGHRGDRAAVSTRVPPSRHSNRSSYRRTRRRCPISREGTV
jgi:hypothetical protein